MKRRWYPGALQWLSVLFFVPVIGYLLFGPADKDNPANLLVWLVWWPLLCILFILAGRFWCGICPFSRVSDGVRSLVGLRWAAPDFLKEQGGWLILIAFILLSWLEETRGILDSPRLAAILLLTILRGGRLGRHRTTPRRGPDRAPVLSRPDVGQQMPLFAPAQPLRKRGFIAFPSWPGMARHFQAPKRLKMEPAASRASRQVS